MHRECPNFAQVIAGETTKILMKAKSTGEEFLKHIHKKKKKKQLD